MSNDIKDAELLAEANRLTKEEAEDELKRRGTYDFTMGKDRAHLDGRSADVKVKKSVTTSHPTVPSTWSKSNIVAAKAVSISPYLHSDSSAKNHNPSDRNKAPKLQLAGTLSVPAPSEMTDVPAGDDASASASTSDIQSVPDSTSDDLKTQKTQIANAQLRPLPAQVAGAAAVAAAHPSKRLDAGNALQLAPPAHLSERPLTAAAAAGADENASILTSQSSSDARAYRQPRKRPGGRHGVVEQQEHSVPTPSPGLPNNAPAADNDMPPPSSQRPGAHSVGSVNTLDSIVVGSPSTSVNDEQRQQVLEELYQTSLEAEKVVDTIYEYAEEVRIEENQEERLVEERRRRKRMVVIISSLIVVVVGLAAVILGTTLTRESRGREVSTPILPSPPPMQAPPLPSDEPATSASPKNEPSESFKPAPAPTFSIPSLEIGVSSKLVRMWEGDSVTYALEAPSQWAIFCDILYQGGGYAYLYMRWDVEPNATELENPSPECYDSYDNCFPGCFDSCYLEAPGSASTLWVSVVAINPTPNATLTCFASHLNPHPAVNLTEGVASDPEDLRENQAQRMVLDIAPRATITCTAISDYGNGLMSLNFETPMHGFEPSFAVDCQTELFFDRSFRQCVVVNERLLSVLHIAVRAATAMQGLQVRCTSSIPERKVLLDGVPSPPTDLTYLARADYELSVTAGSNIFCSTNGAGGDLDLYVRFDQPAILDDGVYDCGSFEASSQESCTVVDTNGASILWVTLSAYEAVVNATVTCTSQVPLLNGTLPPPSTRAPTSRPTQPPTTAPTLVPPVLESGVSVPIELWEGEIVVFTMEALSQEAAFCQLEINIGSADLYIRRNVNSTEDFAPDCHNDGFFEDCFLEVPDGASTLWVAVIGTGSFQNATLTCVAPLPAPLPIMTLDEGVASEPVYVGGMHSQQLVLDIGASVDVFECTAFSASGDGVMSLSFDESITGYERPVGMFGPPVGVGCRHGLNSVCPVGSPGNHTLLWVTVRARTALHGLQVNCTSVAKEPTLLMDGVPSNPIDLEGMAIQYYYLGVNHGSNITCVTNGSSGDLDLFVRFDHTPWYAFDCSSTTGSSQESCEVENSNGASLLWVALEAWGPSRVNDTIVSCTSKVPEDS